MTDKDHEVEDIDNLLFVMFTDRKSSNNQGLIIK